MNKSDLPEPFRGGQGRDASQILSEGRVLLVWSIVGLAFVVYIVWAIFTKLMAAVPG